MRASRFRSLGVVMACGLALGACASFKAKPKSAPVAAAPALAPAPAPASTSQPVAPLIVKVPVPVKEACVPKTFPKAPKYPDSDAALRDAGGAADRYQLMAAGRLLRDRRLAELEKTVDGCR
jgi:hypothetical protein